MEQEGVNVELVELLLPLLASQDLQLGLLLAQSLTQPEQSVAISNFSLIPPWLMM